jgi:hypothetical protein
MNLDFIVFDLIFLGIPIGVLIWFIASLILFIKRDKSDKHNCTIRTISLCLSALFLFVIIAFYLFVMWLLTNMVRYM